MDTKASKIETPELKLSKQEKDGRGDYTTLYCHNLPLKNAAVDAAVAAPVAHQFLEHP